MLNLLHSLWTALHLRWRAGEHGPPMWACVGT